MVRFQDCNILVYISTANSLKFLGFHFNSNFLSTRLIYTYSVVCSQSVVCAKLVPSSIATYCYKPVNAPFISKPFSGIIYDNVLWTRF